MRILNRVCPFAVLVSQHPFLIAAFATRRYTTGIVESGACTLHHLLRVKFLHNMLHRLARPHAFLLLGGARQEFPKTHVRDVEPAEFGAGISHGFHP